METSNHDDYWPSQQEEKMQLAVKLYENTYLPDALALVLLSYGL